jgi:hypothetical protein
MMAVSEFPVAPLDLDDAEQHRRQIAQSVNLLMGGKGNNVIDVTLAASAASTTVTDARIGVNTVCLLMPTTANASAEIGNGTVYVALASRVNGAVAITHANNSQTDRVFKLVLVG